MQILKVLQNLMGVLNPSNVFKGHDHAVVGERTHDKQDRDGRSKRELHNPISRGLALHCAARAS
jgi:hypothetical protein